MIRFIIFWDISIIHMTIKVASGQKYFDSLFRSPWTLDWYAIQMGHWQHIHLSKRYTFSIKEIKKEPLMLILFIKCPLKSCLTPSHHSRAAFPFTEENIYRIDPVTICLSNLHMLWWWLVVFTSKSNPKTREKEKSNWFYSLSRMSVWCSLIYLCYVHIYIIRYGR